MVATPINQLRAVPFSLISTDCRVTDCSVPKFSECHEQKTRLWYSCMPPPRPSYATQKAACQANHASDPGNSRGIVVRGVGTFDNSHLPMHRSISAY
jgi:hypothetical protein